MNTFTPEKIKKIYQALGDDESRDIYKHRLMFSLFSERKEISDIVYEHSPARGLLISHKGKMCYYGAGAGASWIVRYNGRAPFVIDKYKTGMIEGVPIISLDDFLKLNDYRDYLVVVTVGKEKIRDEIQKELESYGLHVVNAYYDLQYFDLQYFDLLKDQKAEKKEYFVDAGALDGGTTKIFLERYPDGHAYVFEPNLKQFEVTKEALADYKETEVFPYGLFDENRQISFEECDTDAGSAKVSDKGTETVEVRKLDDVLGDKPVTFIKMDIEGSELAALKGAEHIIRTQKPKLAICVYHKPEDMWEIPSLILDYNSEYKLFIRHYSISYTETVLYAV